MNETDFKQKLTQIDPSKKSLEFLAKRVLSDNYRGIQISQHNRYDGDFISVLLSEIYDLVESELMKIRTSDLRKRPYNTPDEKTYAIYVNNLNKKLGRCTQDSVRKNFFVDLHRMGFLNRYDKDKKLVDPYERKAIQYVSLTKLGIELVKSKGKIFQQNLIYTKGIDTLLKSLPDMLLDLLLEIQTIDEYEFMFFLSFVNQSLNDKSYTISELSEYVKEYRGMSRFQKTAVIEVINEFCQPENFDGTKIQKRDFHNWKNETQQIFMLLNQTIYFEVEKFNKAEQRIKIKMNKNSVYTDDTRLQRSIIQKQKYFLNHSIEKTKGFELHHIVPLLMARSRNEFDVLDTWENMLYIDGKTHAIITQTGSKNIKLEFLQNDINLKGVVENITPIICKKNENVLYGVKNQTSMQNFNDKVLEEI